MTIQPLPDHLGVGFCSIDPLEVDLSSYLFKKEGRYFNYFFTPKNWKWPVKVEPPAHRFKFDAFSPNLNKQLHVGHLRNLAIATALSRIFKESKFVAMLGRSLGEEAGAETRLHEWFEFLNYHPEEFSDVEMSEKAGIRGDAGEGEQAGCEVWGKPPIIIRRSDGRPTYAMHDLAFFKMVGPDYYLTGGEQAQHFNSLGLGSRHLPMGLVLDPVTGKKMKSRDGNAFSADDALKAVIDRLDKTYEPEQLAWNILAWNLLHSSRTKDVKFNIEDWTSPESQGLYVTYTFARIGAAIMLGNMRSKWNPQEVDLTDADVELLGFSSYLDFFKFRAIQQIDPAPLANFAADLAKKLGGMYHEEKIAEGRPALQFAINHAYNILGETMLLLGMFPITDV